MPRNSKLEYTVFIIILHSRSSRNARIIKKTINIEKMFNHKSISNIMLILFGIHIGFSRSIYGCAYPFSPNQIFNMLVNSQGI